jgi:signal transduction histidine kinase
LTISVDRSEYRAQPDTKIAVMLFKSVSELLTNAVKHASASAVMVRLHGDDRVVRIEVEDDGCGFDAQKAGMHAADDGKYGLFSVQERVRMLGGEFAIDSSQGRGTRIQLQVPIRREASNEED